MPQGLPGIRKGQTLAVYLSAKDVKVTLFYTVSDTTATIVRSMKVENFGNEPVRVNRAYSYALALPNRPWKAVYLSGSVARVVEQFKNLLNRFIEAIAVMMVTTCLIPILVIMFFAWVVKILFNVQINLSAQLPKPKKRKNLPQKENTLAVSQGETE